jgi:hypothetical protein
VPIWKEFGKCKGIGESKVLADPARKQRFQQKNGQYSDLENTKGFQLKADYKIQKQLHPRSTYYNLGGADYFARLHRKFSSSSMDREDPWHSRIVMNNYSLQRP